MSLMLLPILPSLMFNFILLEYIFIAIKNRSIFHNTTECKVCAIMLGLLFAQLCRAIFIKTGVSLL